MDVVRPKSRKRKAEEDEDSLGNEAACPCPSDCQKPPYQLAGNLDNLTLFGMAVTVNEDGNHTLHHDVVELLIDAIDARPKRWHPYWRMDKDNLATGPENKPIRIKRVHDALEFSLKSLDRSLASIRSRSIKAPGQSTQSWWSQDATFSFGFHMGNLLDIFHWSPAVGPVEYRLSQVVREMTALEDLGTSSIIPNATMSQLTKDDVYGRCDKAASALRFQMLRLLAYYESHDDYIQFFRQLVKDLKTTIDDCDSKIASQDTC